MLSTSGFLACYEDSDSDINRVRQTNRRRDRLGDREREMVFLLKGPSEQEFLIQDVEPARPGARMIYKFLDIFH
jgi:hypothetical protein